MDFAEKLLNVAQILANEKGLSHLALQSFSELESLQKQKPIWETLSKKESSLQERIKLSQLGNVLDLMVLKQEIEVSPTVNHQKMKSYLETISSSEEFKQYRYYKQAMN